MSVCPKCGRKLRLTDISQYCPGCGVNMRFYGFEDRFIHDAKQAELAFAKLHVRLRRFKAAFVGSGRAVARLAAAFFPAVSLLVPTACISLNLPYMKQVINLSLPGLIGLFSGVGFQYIRQMSGASVSGELFGTMQNAVFAEASAVVSAVLVLLLSLLCFLSIKHMQKVICAASVLGIVSSAVSAFAANRFCAAATVSDIPLLSGKMSYGYIVSATCFAAVFAVNLILDRRGIRAEYDEGDLERVEIAKKVHEGLLKIEDLPQPIVQTAATRAIEDEIAKERAAFEQKYSVEADNARQEANV